MPKLSSPLRNRSRWLLGSALCVALAACTGSIDEAPSAAAGSSSSAGNTSNAESGGASANAGAAGKLGQGAGASSTSGGGSSVAGGTAGSAAGSNGATTSGGGSSSSGNPVADFACDSAALPPEAVLRRLTMTQYRNTIQDLIQWTLADDAQARSVASELAAELDAVPDDKREAVPQDLHGSYRRLDQSLQQAHVESTYDVAVAAGAALTTSARLAKVVGSCASDTDKSNDASCLDAFVKKFGARALRRPLTSDELTFYKGAYGSDTTASAAAYADLIGIFLTAPEFLYFVEHGNTPVAGRAGVYTLSAYELASRLSYQLWQTAPDDDLLKVAADGSLLKPDVYQAQIQRLLGDARARTTLDEFFQDWTKMEDLPALDAKNSDPVFKAFAGDDLPNATLRKAMQDDVLGLLDFHTWTEPASVASWFSSERSFARDTRLAKIYGVAAWDGSAAPPLLPAGQRPGLLTRALFLASGSSNTRPILKGVFIRKNILCNDIPPPPPGANAKPPVLEPGMTTRESVEALTEMPGSVCSGCHKVLINPLGYATENFDALGRFRTEQRLFDDSGKAAGTKPVDTHGVPQVRIGDPTEIATTAELMQLIAASGAVEACLSRNFFRFTYARWEDDALDGCALRSAHEALKNGGKFSNLLSASVLTSAFQERRFE